MKKVIFLFVLLCLVGVAHSAITNQLNSASFDYKFEGDVSSPTGYTAVNGATASSDGDILTFVSVPYGYYESSDWPTAAAESTGWTFEMKFKVGLDNPSDKHLDIYIASVEDDPSDKKNIIQIKPSEIYAYGKGTISTIDLTDGFHTLRIAQEPGSSTSEFWVDDVQVATYSGPVAVSSSVLQWGALSGADHGTIYIDYIRFTGSGAYAPGDLGDCATEPAPVDGASDVDIDSVLGWLNSSTAYSHDIYLGTDSSAVAAADRTTSGIYKGNQLVSAADSNIYDPCTLSYSTTYYWRIDALDSSDVPECTGAVWSFTTRAAPVTTATNPSPSDEAEAVAVTAVLSWTNGESAYSHDIYIGTDANAVANADRSSDLYKGNQLVSAPDSNSYDPDLGYGATYYWRIDAVNDSNIAQWPGEVWSFTTYKTVFGLVGDLNNDFKVDVYDLELFTSQWLNGPGCPEPNCADFDGLDGVDMTDFAMLAENWMEAGDWYPAAREAAKNRSRRVIHDNDGCDMPYFIQDGDGDGDIDKQDFWDCRFTGLLGTQTDSVVYCTWSSGFSYFTHNTAIGSVFNRTDTSPVDFSNNKTQHYINMGTDSLAMAVEFCKAHNMEIFWSLRLNDTHDRAYTQLFPPLKSAHPEWLMGTSSSPPANGSWTGVDYTHQEIRDLAYDFVEEVCLNYDVNGIMLDFYRHAVLFKSHANGTGCNSAERQMMTDLVSSIRTRIDEIGRSKGHPILLAIRTPDDPNFCKFAGLDIENWMTNKLIDIWVPTGYWRHNSRLASINLGHANNIPVYPSLDESRIVDSIAKNLRNTEDSYSGRAASWLTDGADGIYSFNYDDGYTRYGHYSRLDYLGSLTTLASKDKTYTTTGRGYFNPIHDYIKSGASAYLNFDFILPGEKSKDLNPSDSKDVNILIADDPASSPSVKLKLRSDAGINTSDLAVQFNGNAVSCTGNGSGRMYLDSSVGYTVEWRVRWLDDEGISGSYMCIDCCPQTNKWWLLKVYKSSGKIYAGFYSGSTPVVLDNDSTNTVYHKLRVTVSGGVAELYVDDNSTATAGSGLMSQSILPLRFGDYTNTADGKYDIDYIYAYDGGAVAGGTDPNTWTMRYECDVHPTASNAIDFSDGTTGNWAHNFGQFATASGGKLQVNTIGQDRGTYFTLSEPSWYEYAISPSYFVQGWNTVNLHFTGSSPISIDDFVVEVDH